MFISDRSGQRLRALVERRQAACAAVDAEVQRLRGLGLDWADIGAALGVSRQGARQRYARFDAPESP